MTRPSYRRTARPSGRLRGDRQDPVASHRTGTVRRVAPAIAAFAVLATVAAGCGSNTTNKSVGTGTVPSTGAPAATTAPSGTSSSGSSLVPAKDPKVAGLVPAAIKTKGTLTFAEDATYPPDEFTNPAGQVIGMDADLAKALAGIMGLKADVKNVTFNAIIPGLQAKRYDVGLSSFTDTKAREKVVDFVDYFKAGEAFYVKASGGPTLSGLSNLCGKKVAVESGTTEETDAKTQAATCTTKGKPTVAVQTYQNQNEANLAVSSGRADLGFSDSQVAAYIVSQSHGAFKLSGQAFALAPYGIALPKDTSMTAPTQKAVKALMADGIYTKILTKWGVQSGAITNPVINGATS